MPTCDKAPVLLLFQQLNQPQFDAVAFKSASTVIENLLLARYVQDFGLPAHESAHESAAAPNFKSSPHSLSYAGLMARPTFLGAQPGLE